MKSISLNLKSLQLAHWFCAALVVFSLIILAGYWLNRLGALASLEEATLKEMEHRAASLTTAVNEQTRSTIYSLDLALLHLSHRHVENGTLARIDFDDVMNSTPPGLVRRVTLIDRAGVTLLSYPSGGKGIALGDRPHFKAHLNGQRGLYIGVPIKSRIDNEWVVPLSRRLNDRQGNFAGVVSLMVSPHYFAEIYGRVTPGRDDVVALVHQDGTFVSRSRNLDDHLGKSVRADRPYVGLNAPESGGFRSLSTHEPIDRVWSYRRLNEWPLVVVLGLGVSDALAPVRSGSLHDMQSAVAVSVLVLVLVAGICIVVLRLEQSLVRVRESDERRAMAFAGADELAWEWDVPARQMKFFGDCRPFFGLDADEQVLAIDNWLPLIHPDDLDGLLEHSRRFVSYQSAEMELRFRFRFADGNYRWVLVRGQKVAFADGLLLRALGIMMDVDADRRAQIEATQTREAYRRLIESAGEGIFVVDASGAIELFNPAAEMLLGWNAAEVIGKNAHATFHRPAQETSLFGAQACPVQETLKSGEARRAVRLSYWHKSGRALPVEVSVAPLIVDGRIGGAVIVVADVSQRLSYEIELERLARTDGMTGLWNRRYFVEVFERELHRAGRERQPISLLMIDIDHFKSINDQYGHGAGDTVLIALAVFLRAQLRLVDLTGRLGGEEFGVGLPGINVDEALGVAERLRSGLEALELGSGTHRIRCTVSIGVAMWNGAESFDAFLARADHALYAAKRGGRNRIELDRFSAGSASA